MNLKLNIDDNGKPLMEFRHYYNSNTELPDKLLNMFLEEANKKGIILEKGTTVEGKDGKPQESYTVYYIKAKNMKALPPHTDGNPVVSMPSTVKNDKEFVANTEPLGNAIDEVENLYHSLSLNLPPEQHLILHKNALVDVIDRLKEGFFKATGENPWNNS